MTLDEARESVGRKVVYRPSHVPANEPGEEGIITSVNDTYVFVRYGLTGSQATQSIDLELVGGA